MLIMNTIVAMADIHIDERGNGKEYVSDALAEETEGASITIGQKI